MHVEKFDELKIWMSGMLKNICDADPTALASYILALLKRDRSEQDLKTLCIEQLEVFLQDETHGFVDKLFVALNDKSYLLPLEKLHSAPSNGQSFKHPHKKFKTEEMMSHGRKSQQRISNQLEQSCFSNWNNRVAMNALQSKVNDYERELNRLKKELKASKDYVKELETQVATLKRTLEDQKMCPASD